MTVLPAFFFFGYHDVGRGYVPQLGIQTVELNISFKVAFRVSIRGLFLFVRKGPHLFPEAVCSPSYSVE